MAQTAYLYVGQALHHRGDIDAALLAFDKATKIDGGDASVREAAYYNYAAARFGGGTIPFGSSAKTFEKFLQLYPDGPYSDRVRQYLVEGYMTMRPRSSASKPFAIPAGRLLPLASAYFMSLLRRAWCRAIMARPTAISQKPRL